MCTPYTVLIVFVSSIRYGEKVVGWRGRTAMVQRHKQVWQNGKRWSLVLFLQCTAANNVGEVGNRGSGQKPDRPGLLGLLLVDWATQSDSGNDGQSERHCRWKEWVSEKILPFWAPIGKPSFFASWNRGMQPVQPSTGDCQKEPGKSPSKALEKGTENTSEREGNFACGFKAKIAVLQIQGGSSSERRPG